MRSTKPHHDSKSADAGRHVFWFKGLRAESILGQTPAERQAELPDIRCVRKACTIVLDDLARERAEPCGYELSLLVVGDEEMRALNREHRAKDAATDVLSFPLLEFPRPDAVSASLPDEGRESKATGIPDRGPEPEAPEFWVPGAIPIGDVVIAVETCHRQAVDVGHPVREEFWRLLVHGLLHLFGYDHELSVAEEERMQKREDDLLERIAQAKL